MNEFLSNLAVALVSVLTAKALDIAYDKAKEKASKKPSKHK